MTELLIEIQNIKPITLKNSISCSCPHWVVEEKFWGDLHEESTISNASRDV